MEQYILHNETQFRLIFFIGMFVFVALLELLSKQRELSQSKAVRWSNNLILVGFNSFALRLVIPILTTEMAVLTAKHEFGLLNQLNPTTVDIPSWAKVLLAIVLMDFAIYMQHVMVHAIPLFWRLHRMHHADTDYDVTTGLRFHPLEIILSMCIKLAVIAVLGPPVLGVILFEVVLNATAMFNHGNIRLPKWLDGLLRLVVVTPDMHRVHHSVILQECHSNFGFNLPWWDRIFGTYIPSPKEGQLGMTIGLHEFRDPKELWLWAMLRQPFINSKERLDSLQQKEGE